MIPTVSSNTEMAIAFPSDISFFGGLDLAFPIIIGSKDLVSNTNLNERRLCCN